jgi:hypothetical protein
MTDPVKFYDHPDFVGGWKWTELEIRWIEQKLKEEREACANLVDHILKEGGGTWGDAIRARSEK